MTPGRSLSRLMARVVGTVVAVVLLYWLSFGPAMYLAAKVPATQPAVGVIYLPVEWTVEQERVPPFYLAYLAWWRSYAVPYGDPPFAPNVP